LFLPEAAHCNKPDTIAAEGDEGMFSADIGVDEAFPKEFLVGGREKLRLWVSFGFAMRAGAWLIAMCRVRRRCN
jgi:hypothetical protein